jgi:oxalate decarboxylase/phosphoglucose isomerase-like protein (cupin superfamily)
MAEKTQITDLMASLKETSYGQWQLDEGIPVIEGYGVEDVRQLELAPWPRTEGKGAFINLYGLEAVTGAYVGEIPPGKALAPERHLYEEVICILQGQGATEVWQEGSAKQMFEWGPWSVFAIPLNSWHRLINGGREPVRFWAVTNAPVMMDFLHNADFVFNCPYTFVDRYRGEDGFFAVGTKRYKKGMSSIWETNFIPDVKTVALSDSSVKGSGMKVTLFELSGNALVCHLAEWPVGRYQKAHYHGPGSVLLILQSEGYMLMWPKEIGTQPYQTGHADDLVEVKFKEGSVYCPPANWFHQHFNIGKESGRQFVVRHGSKRHRIGAIEAFRRKYDGSVINVKDGGTMIEYEDEDPQIRLRYDEALRKSGVASKMP